MWGFLKDGIRIKLLIVSPEIRLEIYRECRLLLFSQSFDVETISRCRSGIIGKEMLE